MDLYLIRHPRPAVAAGVCYGQSDVGLAESPEPAAVRLQALLPESRCVYSSPLQRARRLAEALGEVRLDPRLMEIDFGAWEMCRYDDLREGVAAWAADPLGHAAPGGESVHSMAARVHAALADIRARHGSGNVVVVAHGGPLRAIAGLSMVAPTEATAS